MAKKNSKDHARHKYTMTEENIQTKYERLRAAYSSSNNKPIPIVIHNFFSTKKFAAVASDSEQQNLNDSICTSEAIVISNQTGTLANSGNDCLRKFVNSVCQKILAPSLLKTIESPGLKTDDRSCVDTRMFSWLNTKYIERSFSASELMI